MLLRYLKKTDGSTALQRYDNDAKAWLDIQTVDEKERLPREFMIELIPTSGSNPQYRAWPAGEVLMAYTGHMPKYIDLIKVREVMDER